MKRFLKALVLLSVCVFTMTGLSSCKKDNKTDGNNSTTSINIVGEWKTVSMTLAGIPQTDYSKFTKYDADGKAWSINEEGGAYEQDGTWTLSNGALTLTHQDEEGTETITFKVEEISEGKIELKNDEHGLVITLERVQK